MTIEWLVRRWFKRDGRPRFITVALRKGRGYRYPDTCRHNRAPPTSARSGGRLQPPADCTPRETMQGPICSRCGRSGAVGGSGR
ncbi:MAG: hypothetical protein ACYDEV_15300 [Acidiferrobacter sp.]